MATATKGARLRTWVQTLYPAYFASVMATGIVSVSLFLLGVPLLSQILWGIGSALLVVFAAIYLVRAVRFGQAFRQDLLDPTRVFGFFTFVAACGVLATRFALNGWTAYTVGLTAAAFVAWVLLLYWAFAMLLFSNQRSIEQSVNGSWLIAIVGTESLAITWVLLAQAAPEQRAMLQFFAYIFWTFGVLLYVIFITLIVFRFAFMRIKPSDLTPPYWINMGAMAITTVAGVRLLQVAHPTAFISLLQPYIEGFTVMMWAWGTWWIPLLIIIGIWKYGIQREPLRYEPALWSIVFPLGMYSVAVQLLGHLAGLEFLRPLGPWLTWIAFAAWCLVGLSWLWAIASSFRHTAAATTDARLPKADDVGELMHS